jgi:hypothetical protein
MHFTKQHLGILAAVAIVSLGGGFYGGTSYQGKQDAAARAARTSQFGGANGGGRGFSGQGGARTRGFGAGTAGQIVAVGNGTFSVKLQDGSSRIVLFSDSTAITKSDKADKTALAVGTDVFVGGDANSDGSVTAKTVMIR